MAPRLKAYYEENIVPEMIKKFNYRNKLEAPKLKKIVVSMGVGEGAGDIKILENAIKELTLITGQKAVITRAKKAIANFKIKKGHPVGCKVTLRRNMMYEFMDRLINVALPRIRDFMGLSLSSFDKDHNYSLGINEQAIFPEIEFDKITRTQGMNITININAKSQQEAKELLRLFGIPFERES